MQDGTFHAPGSLQETPHRRGNVFAANCPTRQLLDRIGDKWSVLILLLLGEQEMRFNGLKRQVEGVSQKMLSQTLRALERDGLVTRNVVATKPVSVSYGITPLGSELLAALRFLIQWSETRMIDVSAAQRRFDGATA